MLLNLSTIHNHTIAASDGSIGSVSDVLFDDVSWMIRWLVVDTGKWLSGRKVLLPPTALGHAQPSDKTFPVRLTRAEVKASPVLDLHLPVSRQFETSTYDYYGWSPYWGSGYYLGGYGMGFGGFGLMGYPEMQSDPEVQRREADLLRREQNAEPHLRSAEAVTGYHIHATDGEIGHLDDVVLEDTDWSIRYLVVDTANWWGGHKVLISPRSATDIRWTERLIYLDVDRQKIKNSPPYDPNRPLDRDYETRMAKHYGPSRSAADLDRVAQPVKAG
jgi:sporulation protein YlmC with PRC-barrel domain